VKKEKAREDFTKSLSLSRGEKRKDVWRRRAKDPFHHPLEKLEKEGERIPRKGEGFVGSKEIGTQPLPAL